MVFFCGGVKTLPSRGVRQIFAVLTSYKPWCNFYSHINSLHIENVFIYKYAFAAELAFCVEPLAKRNAKEHEH